MAGKVKGNQIYIERLYDAPVKLVWDAWTDPKQAAKWWGPRGFTITTISKELKPGGRWVYTMHGPDGVDWPNSTLYHEVEKYSRLVYDHGSDGVSPPLFNVAVDFIDLKDKTRMEMTMTFESVEKAIEISKFIKIAGGNSTWDRLAEYLEKESTGKENFVINRTFNAPIKTMFEMFTRPEHYSKWIAPTGMDMTFLKADIKVGETTMYMMSDGKGFNLYGKAKYLEIFAPERISYTQQFCDEKGNVIRAPFNGSWPETMLTTIVLTEEGANLTRVTITWELVGAVTPEELATFIAEKAGMTQGWTGSFDKLEDYVTEVMK